MYVCMYVCMYMYIYIYIYMHISNYPARTTCTIRDPFRPLLFMAVSRAGSRVEFPPPDSH